MDQVTLVGPQDIQSLKLHILATHANNTLVDRTFYVHANTADVLQTISVLQQELTAGQLESVFFINEEDLVHPSTCSNKWIYQQLLKLSTDQLRKSHNLTELFLFTDVDTLCLRQTVEADFKHDDKFIFFTVSDNDQPTLASNFKSLPTQHKNRGMPYSDWFWAMNWTVLQLLGLDKAPHLCAIDACVIWSQKILRKLKKDIETRFSISWEKAIVNQFATFLLHYQNNFYHDPAGIRNIGFSLDPAKSHGKQTPGFDELYHCLRLGFSEWQLYTYFLSTLDSSSYTIGLLGDTPHPLVAEFNYKEADRALFDKILDATQNRTGQFPNFIYFYPSIATEDVARIEKVLAEQIRFSQK